MKTGNPLFLRIAEAVRKRCGHRFPRLGGAAFRTFRRLVPAEAEVELFPEIRVNIRFADATHAATYWQGERFEAPAPRHSA